MFVSNKSRVVRGHTRDLRGITPRSARGDSRPSGYKKLVKTQANRTVRRATRDACRNLTVTPDADTTIEFVDAGWYD